MATIILTGGGSAGHCTPHLALLPYLKNNFDKIYYVGSKNGIEREIIERTDIPYYHVSCQKLRRNFSIKNALIPFSVIKGIKEAKKIIDDLKPDVIFSKGGYVSVPMVFAAKKRKIPVISHESDYTVGLANKITSKYCKKVLTSFPETAKSLKNGLYIGSPIRGGLSVSKKKALETFGFNGTKPVLLVIGGSQGAKAINETLREALEELLKKYDIIHVCGKGNLDDSILKKGYYQTEYMHKIENAFSLASVCVSRAGSNALFELLSLKIPCVLIPLPKGTSRGDQVLNAIYFQKQGLAAVLPQNALSKDSLVFNVNSVYANKNNLSKNFTKYPVLDKSRQISRIIADQVKK